MSLRSEDAVQRPSWSSRDPWSPVDRPPGAFPSSPNPSIGPAGEPRTVYQVVKARRDEYIRKKKIKIKVGTWNVAALHSTHKDLGGWFAQGLGVKGLAQDLGGLKADDDSIYGGSSDSEVENIADQEARHRKKVTTLPKHDSPALASGDEVDLYVLGLQEVIDIASVTEAMRPYTDPNPGRKWKQAMRRSLPPGYKKVVEQQLIGLLLLVYASPTLAPEISSVDSTSVGTGLMGYLGNKGAVSARILVGESTRMLFVNSHLAAGADGTALARRIWDTQQILSRTKFSAVGDEWVGGTGQPESIGDEDIAFWFGDLNYRLDDIPGEDVRRLLLLHARNEYDILNASKRRIDSELGNMPLATSDEAHHARDEESINERSAAASSAQPPLDPEHDPASLRTTLKSLLIHDQLHAQQRMRKAFYEGWREGEINFLPTYKYDVGSVAMFDSGEKKRSPSWCDRILYRTRHDYEGYHLRVKQEVESRRRDEDMKRRGLDDAVSQDDVLFNYDPEADGDEYDDRIERHDTNGSGSAINHQQEFKDAVTIEEYVSHQRVLSSDHKPLSAVFTLVYDSVDPTLRAKVHHDVTKEFDRAENEARPSVTLVLDNHSYATSVTDKSPDASQSQVVDFGEVRYRVRYAHHLTIANTGPTQVTYAFVNRPSNGGEAGPFPPWLKVHVQHGLDKTKVGPQDLGTTLRYKLMPGETTVIDLLVEISDPVMVRRLNSGDVLLDDILVLRISNGRDYFVPVRCTWLQTCFHRSVEELVRVPSGVRSLTLRDKGVVAQQQPLPAIVHSAPQELFILTDMIPNLIERVNADWEMLHEEEEPPWKSAIDRPWPFADYNTNVDPIAKEERLAEIREALDTASDLDKHLGPCTDPAERLESLCETLISFLACLDDGLITPDVWEMIEMKMLAYEKVVTAVDFDLMQEIVMEAISTTPIHSVSFTFVTFMLNRITSEISAHSVQHASGTSAAIRRSRSSTSASAMSDVSLSSVRSADSSQTRRSFLPSLIRRTTNSSNVASPVSPASAHPPLQKAQLAHMYAEVFAPLIIRSSDMTAKVKDKKNTNVRKIRALESFINQQP